jgi:hypothetical protein
VQLSLAFSSKKKTKEGVVSTDTVKNTLDKAVSKTALLAALLDTPTLVVNSSSPNISIPLSISVLLIKKVFRNPAELAEVEATMLFKNINLAPVALEVTPDRSLRRPTPAKIEAVTALQYPIAKS